MSNTLKIAGAGVLLLGWLLLCLAAPLLPLTPDAIELARILDGPGAAEGGAIAGYDELGRPLLDRVIAGGRISLMVAFMVVAVSAVVGTIVGAAAAWRGGAVDHVLVRIIDVFLAFPGILLAIALAGVLGPGVGNVVVALSAVGWVGFARLARAQVLSVRAREHVRAAVALGANDRRVLVHHVLPLIAAPLIVEATFAIAAVIIAEAGLSFLGLGVQPPTASWGSIVREGGRYMLVAPHLVIVPSIALFSVVISVNLLGDALRDYLDVRTRERR